MHLGFRNIKCKHELTNTEDRPFIERREMDKNHITLWSKFRHGKLMSSKFREMSLLILTLMFLSCQCFQSHFRHDRDYKQELRTNREILTIQVYTEVIHKPQDFIFDQKRILFSALVKPTRKRNSDRQLKSGFELNQSFCRQQSFLWVAEP